MNKQKKNAWRYRVPVRTTPKSGRSLNGRPGVSAVNCSEVLTVAIAIAEHLFITDPLHLFRPSALHSPGFGYGKKNMPFFKKKNSSFCIRPCSAIAVYIDLLF